MTSLGNKQAAVYMDYENFFYALQKRYAVVKSQTGFLPKMDFSQMVEYINEHIGFLQRGDFLAVGDFDKFDAQKTGINKLATLVNFEPGKDLKRSIDVTGDEKRGSTKNLNDMRLAFEVGYHTALHPVDVYILATNDKAFTPVAQALQKHGRQVIFILPDPDKAPGSIKDNFECLDFEMTQKRGDKGDNLSIETATKLADSDPVEPLCQALSSIRREFTTAVPVTMIKAIFGSVISERLLIKGQGQGRIDFWDDPAGIKCVSRSEERVVGKVIVMVCRPDFARACDLLYQIVLIAESGKYPTPSEWRRALQEQANLSSKEAKELFTSLIDVDILRHGDLGKARLNLTKATRFLQTIINLKRSP
jgi:hypothetical protein